MENFWRTYHTPRILRRQQWITQLYTFKDRYISADVQSTPRLAMSVTNPIYTGADIHDVIGDDVDHNRTNAHKKYADDKGKREEAAITLDLIGEN